MMKTLVIANQKGGVGKTSTLVHLAFDFAERGLKVAVIDLDTQGNASFTLGVHKGDIVASSLFGAVTQFDLAPIDNIALVPADARLADLEKLDLQQAANGFRESIAVISAHGFDVCLIDTAPSLGNAMASALLAADFVASPIELEAYALQGITKMNATIAAIRKANTKLQFLGMIPSKVDGRNPRHTRYLAELQAAYPALIMPTPIGYRSSIADALASHCPVWEIRRTSARAATKEVRAMTQHIHDKMEIA
ncbi:ParA family protein [Sphingomonas sp. PAMC 26605]|uniref:ParA family protein n=1 Tax=Sphingomonas sp. PAMC 26605 TaxID=1112214 RepID=UPI001E3F622D|nr:ParA family protein [Sphingomonas sp. PAMC 26605]